MLYINTITMKTYILALLFMPFMSCADNGNTMMDLAYSSHSESVSNSTKMSHQGWNALLQKHVTRSGKVDYLGFKNDVIAPQSYLDLLAKNLPKKSWSINATLAY